MNNINLIETFSEFKEFKNIDRPTMMRVLEDVFRSMLRKKYNTDENFDIIVNTDKGDLEIFRNRTIVEDDFLEDDDTEVALSEAIKISPDFELGEELTEEIKFEDFGRRAILAARQTLVQRIMELEKDTLFHKYKDRIGEIVSGEVYQVWKKEALILDDEGNELLLPRTEMIPADFLKKADTVKAVISRVEMVNTSPKIILSRIDPMFLSRLLELEVPEIFDGLITIKKIVREAGERAKVAVESYDDRIDPVGACVGMKGSRIQGIVRELKGESIDIINWTNNQELLIQRALSPAKVVSIKVDAERGKVRVTVKPDQVSMAIGKGGHNIKLAGKLTGFEIDVFRDNDTDADDIDLDEFNDEIEEWMISELRRAGFDTAKAVLERSDEDLVRLTELEEETVADIRKILMAEFEPEAPEAPEAPDAPDAAPAAGPAPEAEPGA